MTKLETAKKIIEENYYYAKCGIFNCRSLVNDPIALIYNDDGLDIYLCYHWGYFEVFGLTNSEFRELEHFYNKLCGM